MKVTVKSIENNTAIIEAIGLTYDGLPTCVDISLDCLSIDFRRENATILPATLLAALLLQYGRNRWV